MQIFYEVDVLGAPFLGLTLTHRRQTVVEYLVCFGKGIYSPSSTLLTQPRLPPKPGPRYLENPSSNKKANSSKGRQEGPKLRRVVMPKLVCARTLLARGINDGLQFS